jgi:hypothetical protein
VGRTLVRQTTLNGETNSNKASNDTTNNSEMEGSDTNSSENQDGQHVMDSIR